MADDVRAWCAVRGPRGIRCEVRDVPCEEAQALLRGDRFDDGVLAWRVAPVADFDASTEWVEEGCACVPGRPCEKCRCKARLRWRAHEARREKRSFRSWEGLPPEVDLVDGCSWGRPCGHEKRHTTWEKAVRCADRHGLRLVVVSDGNGRLVEVRSSGVNVQVEMFPRGG